MRNFSQLKRQNVIKNPVVRPYRMAKKKRKRKSKPPARFPRLKFEWGGEPLTTATINHFGHILHLTDDHRKLLRKSNGGTSDSVYFQWSTPDGDTTESCLDNFIGIDNRPFGPDRQSDIVSVILAYRDYLPPFAVPLAGVDRDDILLTFTAGDRHGEVWLLISPSHFIDDDCDPEEHLYFVSNSIPAFLSSLHKPDDPYSPVAIALDTPKVRGKQLASKLATLGCKPFKFKGVSSQTALPPTWEWPIYQRADDDLPAVLSVEKNHTYGYAPKCDERSKGHKIMMVNVTKSQRKKCIRDLLVAFGDNAVEVDA